MFAVIFICGNLFLLIAGKTAKIWYDTVVESTLLTDLSEF